MSFSRSLVFKAKIVFWWKRMKRLRLNCFHLNVFWHANNGCWNIRWHRHHPRQDLTSRTESVIQAMNKDTTVFNIALPFTLPLSLSWRARILTIKLKLLALWQPRHCCLNIILAIGHGFCHFQQNSLLDKLKMLSNFFFSKKLRLPNCKTT